MRTAAGPGQARGARAKGPPRRPPERRAFRFSHDSTDRRRAPQVTSHPVVRRLLLATPRGYCAGVERAVATVERALELHGPPVFVRKQIVHNTHVVRELEERGAVFVESETDVPEGAVVVLSAHGVAPAVVTRCHERGLRTIDATCPLVTKVHVEARRLRAGRVQRRPDRPCRPRGGRGDVGARRRRRRLVVGSLAEVEQLDVPDPRPRRLRHPDDAVRGRHGRASVEALRRVPRDREPPVRRHLLRDDESAAGGQGAREVADIVLVIGSRNSSNSNRLVEIGLAAGVPSHLIEDEGMIDERWLDGVETVGLTSGASAPEPLVARVCEWFRRRGVTEIRRCRRRRWRTSSSGCRSSCGTRCRPPRPRSGTTFRRARLSRSARRSRGRSGRRAPRA